MYTQSCNYSFVVFTDTWCCLPKNYNNAFEFVGSYVLWPLFLDTC